MRETVIQEVSVINIESTSINITSMEKQNKDCEGIRCASLAATKVH